MTQAGTGTGGPTVTATGSHGQAAASEAACDSKSLLSHFECAVTVGPGRVAGPLRTSLPRPVTWYRDARPA